VAAAAVQVQAHTRALQHFEAHLRERNKTAFSSARFLPANAASDTTAAALVGGVISGGIPFSRSELSTLQELYAGVEDPDSLSGITALRTRLLAVTLVDHGATAAQSVPPEDQLRSLRERIRDLEHEDRWEDAILCYEQAIQCLELVTAAKGDAGCELTGNTAAPAPATTGDDPMIGDAVHCAGSLQDVERELHSGLLRCLSSVGHVETAMDRAIGVARRKPLLAPAVIPHAMEAAWRLCKWDTLDGLLRTPSGAATVALESSVTPLDPRAGFLGEDPFTDVEAPPHRAVSAAAAGAPAASTVLQTLTFGHLVSSGFLQLRGMVSSARDKQQQVQVALGVVSPPGSTQVGNAGGAASAAEPVSAMPAQRARADRASHVRTLLCALAEGSLYAGIADTIIAPSKHKAASEAASAMGNAAALFSAVVPPCLRSLTLAPNPPLPSGSHLHTMSLGAGAASVSLSAPDRAAHFGASLESARLGVMSSLAAASMESYTRAYPWLVRLHCLREMERAADLIRVPDAASRDNMIAAWDWDSRLVLTSPSAAVREAVLAPRHTLFRIFDMRDREAGVWLDLARLARTAGNHAAASAALLNARSLGSDIADIQASKLLYLQGHVHRALQLLEPVERDLGAVEERLQAARDAAAGKGEARVQAAARQCHLEAKRALYATKWMAESRLISEPTAIERFRAVCSLHPSWEKAWFTLGKFFDSMLKADIARAGESPAAAAEAGGGEGVRRRDSYILGVIDSYCNALVNGHDHIFEALPRVLTLMFDYGACCAARSALIGAAANDNVASNMLTSLVNRTGISSPQVRLRATSSRLYLHCCGLPRFYSRTVRLQESTLMEIISRIKLMRSKVTNQARACTMRSLLYRLFPLSCICRCWATAG
jgi:tetratricopeptide (TPR) repeat protein